MSNGKLGTVLDGLFATSNIDSSGEVIEIEGVDVSTLDVDGVANWEHKGDSPNQIVGKVLSYKKLFKREDCENDRQRYFWDKAESSCIYGKIVLFDEVGHEGAKSIVAMLKFDQKLDKTDTRQVMGFSIEGSRLGKEGNRITKCIARRIAISNFPCNKTCIAEILDEEKPIEITAKQLLAAFKKSEEIESDLKKAEVGKSKFLPKKTKEFSSIVPEPKAHKPALPYQPSRTFTSEESPKNLRVGDRITYTNKPKTKSSTYKDPETWKSETNTVRQSILKNMSKQNMHHRMMLSEEKENMRKDILKKMADDAFEHFEKKEELVDFVATQYPEMTEQEVLAFAKTFAYVQMKKSEMEMVKITNSIEGNDLQKAAGEKGVHQRHPKVTFHDNKGKYLEGKTQGTSRAGHMNIEARRGERDPQDVLDAHSNKLKELKAMPKPNLPKSEKDVVKADHTKKNTKKQLTKPTVDSKKAVKNSKVEKKDRCWDGYEPTPGKKAYSEGSCKPIKKNAITSNEIHLYKYEDGTAEIIWGDGVSEDQVEKIIKTELQGWEENSENIEKKEKPFRGYNPERHSKTGGLNDKFREKYNREHGSDLKRPVTGEVKAGSKSAKRRKSFCARMSGMKGATSKDGELTPKGASLKRWKC